MGNRTIPPPRSKGRPPTIDYNEMAKDLLEWSSKDDALVLRAWAAKMGITQDDMQTYRSKSQAFARAYQIAHNRVGVNRELLAIKQNQGAGYYQRYAAVYDKELAEHERVVRSESKGDGGAVSVVLVDKGSLDAKAVAVKAKQVSCDTTETKADAEAE